MDYETLPLGAVLMQDKTNAFLTIGVDNVDVGLWWQLSGGTAAGKLRVTLQKPGGALIVKDAADEVDIVNTSPQQVKVLILEDDIDFVGNLTLFAEFLLLDGWQPALPVTVAVIDDPIAGS